MKKYLPILEWLPYYTRAAFAGDLSAGLTVGIMLIPQGMAYAMIAGMPPVYGLYASIVPQLIYALLGTSRQLSVAPVAMDSLLVAAGVSVMAMEGTETYIQLAILVAFFMGFFQVLLGLFRMGFITNLLAQPVISGFTSAAAIIIGINQLKYLTGVSLVKSNRVYEIVWQALERLSEIHYVTLLIGLLGIVLIKVVKRYNKMLPGSLFAVVLGTVAVYLLQLDTQGVSIVREIPEGLPAFKLPSFAIADWAELVPLALTISVVAFMEAFSVSKTLEVKHGNYRVRPNQELIGLGMANVVGSMFQSFPVTGGFSRSAVNDQSGAVTPMASIISAVLVGLTLLLLTPLFYYLPEAILAAVVMVAVAGLMDFKYAYRLWKTNKPEFFLLLTTFMVTLNFSMVPGIVTGIILSILLLLYREAYPHIALLGRVKGHHEYRNVNRFKELETWPHLLILRLDGPLNFVNIQFFRDYIERALSRQPQITAVIFDAAPVNHIDATGAKGLEEQLISLKERNITLVMTDVVGPVRDILHRTGMIEKIGTENIYLNLHGAVEHFTSDNHRRYEEYALQHND